MFEALQRLTSEPNEVLWVVVGIVAVATAALIALIALVVCLVLRVRSLNKRAIEREILERSHQLAYGTSPASRSPKSEFRRLVPQITFPVPQQTSLAVDRSDRSAFSSTERLASIQQVFKKNKSKKKKLKGTSPSSFDFHDSHYNGHGVVSPPSESGLVGGGGHFSYEFLNLPRGGSPTSSVTSGASSSVTTSNGFVLARPSTSSVEQDNKSIPDNVSWWLTIDESDAGLPSQAALADRMSGTDRAEMADRMLDAFQASSAEVATDQDTDLLIDEELTDAKMTSAAAMDATHETPLIDFKLYYSSATSRLSVTVIRVTNLPIQFHQNVSSFVKVSLLTHGVKRPASYVTQVVKKTLNPDFFEETEFAGYSFAELKIFTVRFVVYCKRQALAKRQRVGDLCVPLFRPDLEPERELMCREPISLVCPNTGKRGPLLMAGERGFILVQLQLQPEARRLKIYIRKGQNLPTSRQHGLASIEFFVLINLLRSGESIFCKETRCVAGGSPVWNQAFLIPLPADNGSDTDVDAADPETGAVHVASGSSSSGHPYGSQAGLEEALRHFRIQLVVMRSKSSYRRRDAAVGQVLIGEEVPTPAGSLHWREMIVPDWQDVTKWHSLAPLDTACLKT